MTPSRSRVARYIAASGMALALCMMSLMLFRGVFSLVHALIIPMVIVLLTVRQPRTYQLAVALSLLFLTFAFFPTQLLFVMIYLLMALVLQKLPGMMQGASRLHYLLFVPYLFIIGLLLFLGLIMTDFVFLTQLHPMMLRMSGGKPILYAAIIMLESAFVSGFHLLFILFFRRRLTKVIEKTTP